ncbi:Luciferase-like monooxygenase [Beutenbergia cavernae DSM 12333]|uniref:Luciferase-like monooxygenase n=1 Tax=Beutenbergia cavernae (strain ATCC BAA-8 / DSM 12333 / CCUG 43141 / JCM 11478 / NBRC 16432 / NCIMB 13614 / HKI 0122) TaxID=471853 RepID=C5BYZ2_BEUC1|nr:LLM class flavin-dependent oxidoreductase [Beutenbergia cavernae]ACQ81107.1 Luciferase-like monooxygenase [Beutenbergia cavernae DSM 12333]
MTDPTIAVVLRPQVAPERLRESVRAAESAGLEEVWLWEDCFLTGGISTAALALAWTESLRVGVGLLPVPLRNPALAAMELATLERVHPGRFLPGLGHGVLDWMGQVGARAASPMTLLREYTVAVRSLLAGERVDAAGDYVQLDGVALDWPPAAPPPVYLGATGARTLRLAGEVADGTILVSSTGPDGVRAALEHVREGREAAGRTDPHEVVAYVSFAPGPDGAERVRREHEPSRVLDPERAALVGDVAAMREVVAAYRDAGVTTIALEPVAEDPELTGVIDVAAELAGR